MSALPCTGSGSCSGSGSQACVQASKYCSHPVHWTAQLAARGYSLSRLSRGFIQRSQHTAVLHTGSLGFLEYLFGDLRQALSKTDVGRLVRAGIHNIAGMLIKMIAAS
jgi:hypothetical protein